MPLSLQQEGLGISPCTPGHCFCLSLTRKGGRRVAYLEFNFLLVLNHHSRAGCKSLTILQVFSSLVPWQLSTYYSHRSWSRLPLKN